MKVVVRVIDVNTGNPIVGAAVALDGRTGTTGSDGTVAFDVPRGAYTLTVSKDGYDTEEVRIRIVRERTITIPLTPLVGVMAL